jgi:orotate phosphoribosyltransferase
MSVNVEKVGRAFNEAAVPLFGDWVNPNTSQRYNIHYNLDKLRSSLIPKQIVASAVAKLISNLDFDFIVDTEASLTPLVSTIADISGRPQLTMKWDPEPRRVRILGDYEKGATVLAVTDVIRTGQSLPYRLKSLRDKGLKVYDALAIVNVDSNSREGVKDYYLHSLINETDLTRYYGEVGIQIPYHGSRPYSDYRSQHDQRDL